MSDLKTFVKKTVREVLKTDYPSMDKMHSIPARVTDVQQQDGTYRYTVKPLDADTGIPNLVSDQIYRTGDAVVIQFVEGIYPYIIGRWYG